MAKTAVYRWRVSPATKSALEDEARERGETVADLLDRIANEWLLLQQASTGTDRQREARLRERALRSCGTIAGGNPDRAARARMELRRRLRSRRANEHPVRA
jgi:hypothetical protein